MKKLIVLAFLVTASLAACSKSKPAATTPKPDDAKMEPAPAADGDKKPDGDAKPEGDAPKDPEAAPK